MSRELERRLERLDARERRAEGVVLRQIGVENREAALEILAALRRRWQRALEDAERLDAVGRSARARALLAQISTALERVRARPLGAPARAATEAGELGALSGARAADASLRAYGMSPPVGTFPLPDLTSAQRVNLAALERHAARARDAIDDAVTTALVRGQSYGGLARTIREILEGDARGTGRARSGGLSHRARVVARTELARARTEASKDRYRAASVDLVQWYATQDERTCPICAARHGKVYAIDDAVVPAHPLCRCYLAPFSRELTDAGLVDREYWRDAEREIQERVPDLRRGASPFEKAEGRDAPRAVWTPRSGWLS